MKELQKLKVLQDPEIDREPGITVATVLPAALAGRVWPHAYYREDLAGWVLFSSPPQTPSVPAGVGYQLSVMWANDSSIAILGRLELVIKKPDGIEINVEPWWGTPQEGTLLPGGSVLIMFLPLVLDQAGTYQATMTLTSGGETLAAEVFDCAVVAEAEVAGRIRDYGFWDPAAGAFVPLPPTILVGQEAGVTGYFSNDSPFVQNMRLDAVVLAPDGTETTHTGQVLVTDPTFGWWQDFTWVCDQAGVYEVTLILYGEIAA